MKKRLFTSGMVQHGGLGMVDEHLNGTPPKNSKAFRMSAQEVLGRLTEAKLEVAKAAVATNRSPHIRTRNVILDGKVFSLEQIAVKRRLPDIKR